MKTLLLLSSLMFFSNHAQALPITCPAATGVGTVTCDCSAGNLLAHNGVCNIKCGSTGGCESLKASAGDNSLVIIENKKIRQIKNNPIIRKNLIKKPQGSIEDHQNEVRVNHKGESFSP